MPNNLNTKENWKKKLDYLILDFEVGNIDTTALFNSWKKDLYKIVAQALLDQKKRILEEVIGEDEDRIQVSLKKLIPKKIGRPTRMIADRKQRIKDGNEYLLETGYRNELRKEMRDKLKKI